jgi:hypothetical protein
MEYNIYFSLPNTFLEALLTDYCVACPLSIAVRITMAQPARLLCFTDKKVESRDHIYLQMTDVVALHSRNEKQRNETDPLRPDTRRIMKTTLTLCLRDSNKRTVTNKKSECSWKVELARYINFSRVSVFHFFLILP